MGFFSDLKEDLSQAVDELMPNENGGAAAGGNHIMTQEEIMAAFAAAAAAEEPASEVPEEQQTSDTVQDAAQDVSDISLEEMLKNIDSIAFPEEDTTESTQMKVVYPETQEPAAEDESDPADMQSLEDMLAAAIAALPEEEEQIPEEPQEPVAEAIPEPVVDAELESILEELSEPAIESEPVMEAEPEPVVEPEPAPVEELLEASDTEIAAEWGGENAEAEAVAVADVIGEEPDAMLAEEDGPVYDGLELEEDIPEELVIEEPMVEEAAMPETFRRELLKEMPFLEETQEQQSSVPAQEDADRPEEAPKADMAQIAEMNLERAAKEMSYVAEGTSVIAAGMNIYGDLFANAPVSVMGAVEGNVETTGKLSVSGQIHGNVRAAEVYAEGAKLTGDIVSDGAVKLGSKAVVLGNISANSAAIAGAVKGDIDVHGPIILDSTAIVVGNIKFKSIQINNGAVIEGMCLQCYADINPTSFFDAV
ncbi:MAG: polymer-forming cytoskeletal protein [Lachnospiraceae bacterium]|nr:polymer-forming cytoskeletal protein [Lachnospiraceae bacterium]